MEILNLGQLLNLVTNEKKVKIRTLEKFHKSLITNAYGIIFNRTCIKERLLPNFTNIYTYILGWPLGIGNFQKLKIMLLPPPYLVPIIKKINCDILAQSDNSKATLKHFEI